MDKSETLIAVFLGLGAILFVIGVFYNAMHPCIRYAPSTGATTCWGDKGYMHCEPDRECLERAP